MTVLVIMRRRTRGHLSSVKAKDMEIHSSSFKTKKAWKSICLRSLIGLKHSILWSVTIKF